MKIIAALVTAFVLVGLTGCAEPTETTPKETQTVTKTVEPAPEPKPEPPPEPEPVEKPKPKPEPVQQPKSMRDLYLPFVRANTTELLEAMSEEDLVQIIEAACEAMDAGVMWEELLMSSVQTSIEEGWSETMSREFSVALGAGVEAYCPQHSKKVSDYAESLG